MKSLKRVFDTIYIFFNDIRIYLIAYNVIVQYFRRSKTTKIANLIADHILIHIYKNYLIPRLFSKSKFIKETPQEFQDEFLINKFVHFKDKIEKNKNKNKLYDKLDFLDKESLDSYEIYIIIKSNSLRLFEDENYLELNPNEIKFKDFIEEICYYSLKKNKNIIGYTDKYELEFEILKFKAHLGEWLIASFEDRNIITLGWKLGARNINILNLDEKEKNKKKLNESDTDLIEFNK